MQFIGWMVDLARDQCPDYALLDEICSRSQAAGYNALGLYLEHRFAYASAPWAAAPGCLTPDVVGRLNAKYTPKGFRIVPFLNVLGHVEGFIRAEGGRTLSEGRTTHAEQMCPSRPENVEFVRGLVLDALAAFDDEWVHLGGDETWQLGSCDLCRARAEKIGKAGIYAEHFAPLCELVIQNGRRPALWGDMLLEHAGALHGMPNRTVIFDWHYDCGPAPTAARFRESGFDVVCCPNLKIFDANWSALDLSRRNVDEHAAAVDDVGALGVCVTTWEANYFAIFRSYLPLIYAAGRHLAAAEPWDEALLAEGGPGYARAAKILGREIPATATFLAQERGPTIRANLAMRLNPFYLWMQWRQEACSEPGDRVLELCDEADALLDEGEPLKGPVELHRTAVHWVRDVEEAYRAYARRDFAGCTRALARGRDRLENLRPHLEDSAKHGGAHADLARLDVLQRRADEVALRVSQIESEPSRAYLPSFEVVVDGGYVAGDTAAWRTGAWR